MKYLKLLVTIISLTAILSCDRENEVTSSSSRIQVDRTPDEGLQTGSPKEQNRRHEELMIQKLPVKLPANLRPSEPTPSVAGAPQNDETQTDAIDIEINKLKDEIQKLRAQNEEYTAAISKAEKESPAHAESNSLETLKENAKRTDEQIAEKIMELNHLSSKRMKVER